MLGQRVLLVLGLTVLSVVMMTSTVSGTTALVEDLDVSGKVRSFSRSSTASGVPLQIDFQQISYSGMVKNVWLVPKSQNEGEFQISMELENVRFTIGSTSIRGLLRMGAECGPMQIELGTRQNLFVYFQLKGTSNDYEIRDTKLTLAEDNWRINNPKSIRTSGFGVTESRVASGLRTGLQENRNAIESIMCEEAELILARFKKQIAGNMEQELGDKLKPSETIVASQKSETEATTNSEPTAVEETTSESAIENLTDAMPTKASVLEPVATKRSDSIIADPIATDQDSLVMTEQSKHFLDQSDAHPSLETSVSDLAASGATSVKLASELIAGSECQLRPNQRILRNFARAPARTLLSGTAWIFGPLGF